MIARVHSIMDILSANVETSLTVEELDLLMKKFYSTDMQEIQTTSLQGGGHLINGVWENIIRFV
jgi:anionic cell wall polymer biosynthesis LytR-Cps2A-Psr (LCP) family protein